MSGRSASDRIGLVALAIFFIVAVSFSNAAFRGLRLDLTENRLYTLSDGTEKVLAGIDEPINLYFFFSDRATSDIPYLRTYADRVREMLREFSQRADGKLRITEIDPLPFSEDEDRASQFGLQSAAGPGGGDPIYMGIAGTNSVGDEEVIAFLDPTKETFLEYDLAKLIYTLANPERPVIGLITDLPMTSGFDAQSGQMRQPWLITSEIRQLFELRTLPSTTTRIDDDIDVLMLVHPKTLDDQTLYVIDQFILGGGRALIAVDPYAEADIPAPDPANPAAAMMASRASDLERLLGAWGVSVADGEVIGDDRYALTVSGLGARPTRHIALIGVDESGIDTQDVVMSGIRNLNLGYAGYITSSEDAPATVSPLIRSSDLAGTISTESLGFMRDPNALREEFAPTGERYILAARVTGTVPSAFPEGLPASGDEGQKNEEGHLTESAEPVNVILLADTDLLTDRLWAQVQSFLGQQLTTAFAGNGNFIVNALDNLTGSGDLISVRGRETFSRPFTRVEDLRREAEARYRDTEERLQRELAETEAKLTELQASREDSDTLILSAEQQAELERFQEERLRIRKDLRQVRRELDQSIEDLGAWLKAINIALVPLLVVVAGLLLNFLRRRGKIA